MTTIKMSKEDINARRGMGIKVAQRIQNGVPSEDSYTQPQSTAKSTGMGEIHASESSEDLGLPKLVYWCFLLAFIGGLPLLVGLVVLLIKYSGTKGKAKTHLRNMLRVLLFGLLWCLLSYGVTFLLLLVDPVLSLVVLVLLISAIGIWQYYRIINGIVKANRNESYY